MKKLCKKCGEIKSVQKFSKRSKSKDGFQHWCNDCRLQYQYANNQPIIYQITNPLGETYIGSTMMKLWKRWTTHKAAFNTKTMRPSSKLLMSSFEKNGIENHTIETLAVLGRVSRKEMYQMEMEYIKRLQPKLNTLGK